MTGQPAHRYLEEFPSEIVPPLTSLLGLRPRVADLPSPAQITARLAEAFERGVAEGRSVERGLADNELARVALEYDAQIEDIRNNFAQSLIERLALELRDGLARERDVLGSRLAGVLVPVLKRVLTEASIRDFSGELSLLLGSSGDAIAELTGPEELLNRITVCLEECAGAQTAEWSRRIRLAPSPSTEVRVQLGNSIIEMRLTEWLARIEEAVR